MVSFVTVKLGIDESAWLTLNTHIPKDQVSETIDVYLNVTSWDTDENETRWEIKKTDNQELFVFKITNADLVIASDLIYNKNMKTGKFYSIKTKIGNIGDIYAEDVLVILKVDGMEVLSKVIQHHGVNQVQEVSFEWKATEGSHRITIEIDPLGDIIEKNDQRHGTDNNLLTQRITVGEAEGSYAGIALTTWGVFAAIVIGGTLLILGIAYVVKRNRM